MEMFKVRSPVTDPVVETEEWPVAPNAETASHYASRVQPALSHTVCAETRCGRSLTGVFCSSGLGAQIFFLK